MKLITFTYPLENDPTMKLKMFKDVYKQKLTIGIYERNP